MSSMSEQFGPFGLNPMAPLELPSVVPKKASASTMPASPEQLRLSKDVTDSLKDLQNKVHRLEKIEVIKQHFQKIMEAIGITGREGTADTPARYAKFLLDFTSKETFNLTIFNEPGVEELQIQNGIQVYSLCEHHTLPFFGTASIAYIPNNGRIVGLSKFARLVRYYASDFQNQERLTRQIGEALANNKELMPRAVGVSLCCTHTCMTIRGVREHGAKTVTNYLYGQFQTNPSSRQEFLDALQHE